MSLARRPRLSFSLDGSRLFFGTTPPPEPEKDPDKEPPDEEKVLVDFWHWKDDFIQPIQKIRAEQDRNKSYRAVYHVKEKKFVQLADETMENLRRRTTDVMPSALTIAPTAACAIGTRRTLTTISSTPRAAFASPLAKASNTTSASRQGEVCDLL